jgi:hypothetical protein
LSFRQLVFANSLFAGWLFAKSADCEDAARRYGRHQNQYSSRRFA